MDRLCVTQPLARAISVLASKLATPILLPHALAAQWPLTFVAKIWLWAAMGPHLYRPFITNCFANITVLPAQGNCTGFDTGPGNLLLDSWCNKHLAKDYDADGEWAAGGRSHKTLLKQLKNHPFFTLPAPKSTGREAFHQQWLEQQLSQLANIAPQDVQATLVQFTAETIADEINSLDLSVDEVYICGGGAFNGALMASLKAALTARLDSTSALGLDPNWVEASAFAWLAKQRLEAGTGNIAAVTGAERDTVLGGLYLP